MAFSEVEIIRTGGKLKFTTTYGVFFVDSNIVPTGTVDTVTSISDLGAYAGTSNSVIVTDLLRGGVFVRSDDALTNDDGKIFARTGGGHWVRQVDNNNVYYVEWFGGVGDGISDDLPYFNAALAGAPYGRVIQLKYADYGISDTIAIVGQIQILGAGLALSHVSQISLLSGFPAGNPAISFDGGYSAVVDVRINMNFRGGSAIKCIGEGGHSYVERNDILQVNTGYWGLELSDPGGTNGIAGMNINDNRFEDFLGGGIWGNGGGDSNYIQRNFFQLGNSTSHILLWDGVAGAANLNFIDNNGTGAEKFIEINFTVEPKIMRNQLEATIPLTNASDAMITINGNVLGATISDNNLNCHSGNATKGIYLDDVQWCMISNNTTTGDTYSIETTVNTTNVTLIKGYADGTINDVGTAITILN